MGYKFHDPHDSSVVSARAPADPGAPFERPAAVTLMPGRLPQWFGDDMVVPPGLTEHDDDVNHLERLASLFVFDLTII